MKNKKIKILSQDLLNEEGILNGVVVVLEYLENSNQIHNLYHTAYPKNFKYYDPQFLYYNLIFN